MDYNLFPDKTTQLPWLRHYLECKFEKEGKNSGEVTEKDVETLYVQANKFSLVRLSHSIISCSFRAIQNFVKLLAPEYCMLSVWSVHGNVNYLYFIEDIPASILMSN